jgi:two-component system sensor kinase FixL
MNDPAPARRTRSRWLSVVTVLFALWIFFVDTFTPLDIAIAVLYVVVVLMAANLFERRGLLLASGACLFLTVAAFVISHGLNADAAFLRCLVSLAAIVITTILALANQSTTMRLREQAELLDLTHDAVMVRDMGGKIAYWNRGAEQLYGWRKEEALGRSSHDLLHTVFSGPRTAIEAELLKDGRWEGDIVHTTRDGRQVAVASRWALERDERGQPTAVLETNTDVTERNRAQEGLHQAQAQVAHVSRVTTLGELVASIAHEVNQPLAAIVTNGEVCLRWMDRDPPDLQETRDGITRTIQAARRASEVIARLRALSRRGTSERLPVDIGDVVTEVVTLVQREMLTQRVSLQLDITSPLMTIGDRVQLQQVIMNLLINGIQATTGIDDRPRELTVRSIAHDEGQVLVSVEDNGVGVAPEDELRLFQAFFTKRADGMGMGLSISRSIIESHGGRIWVSRNTGPGATFRFTLPAAEAAAPE